MTHGIQVGNAVAPERLDAMIIADVALLIEKRGARRCVVRRDVRRNASERY